MSTNSAQNGVEPGGIGVSQRVSISRWVNEPYPAWDRILTAHDVARLIRRPPWMLFSMAAVGQFPRKQRFRGKSIGWRKEDILEWIVRTCQSRVATTSDKIKGYRRAKSDPPSQQTLPLKNSSERALNGHTRISSIARVSP
jgi:predicted DNA-binding transcriptional regulator AlpA